MYNLVQDLINAVYGYDVLDISTVDPNLLFLGGLFFGWFAYRALRSLVRTITNIRFS